MYNKRKMSIDFTLPEYKLLSDVTKKSSESSSSVINELISVFLPIKPVVKKKLSEFCFGQYTKSITKLQNEISFGKQEEMDAAAQWLSLSKYFEVTTAENEELTMGNMKRIMLKDGYLLIPKDFIVLSDVVAPAEECLYAGVVEARNGAKYGIPHFVFFSNYKYAREYDDELETKVYEACKKVFPDFKSFFNMQIKMPNSLKGEDWSDSEVIAKMDEWDKAPTFGLFAIVEKGDPLYWNSMQPDYNPPYGAMIVRLNDIENEDV